MSDTIDTINDIVAEVAEERLDQIEKWGTQEHDPLYGEGQRRQFEKLSTYWHQVNDARVAEDKVTWDGILLEEVFEALAETDLDLMRHELIQVAAVAAAAVEEIDRRLAQPDPEPSEAAGVEEVAA